MPSTVRYAAFLRGVSPMNLKMPQLARCLEAAGFTNVVTVLSSGNAVFDGPPMRRSAVEAEVEAALADAVGRPFPTIVRTQGELRALLEADPWPRLRAAAGAKRVVTFLKKPAPRATLPPEVDGARILAVDGTEVFTTYLPTPRGPVFMQLIEKTFGKDVTTRTWDTVRKVAAR